MTNAYLNFGGPGTVDGENGPRITVVVPYKYTRAPRHHGVTGYGHAIPSSLMVLWTGRWRRVYVCQYGNAGTAFIGGTRKSDMWIATVCATVI